MLQHLERMASAGYDDVHDYVNMSAADLEACSAELKAAGMPPGHAGKIIRAMSAPVTPAVAAGQKRAAEPVPEDLQHLVAGASEGAGWEVNTAPEGTGGGAAVS